MSLKTETTPAPYTPVKPQSSCTEIPILDLEPYFSRKKGAEQKLSNDLRHAQENIGFYYIINHGISKSLIKRCFSELKTFFALPFEEKIKLKFDHNMIGYVPPKSTIYETSTINKNTKKDQNETLLVGVERDLNDPLILQNKRFTIPNRWPEGLPVFRQTMIEYQKVMMDLGRNILQIYALALDKPADYFNKYFNLNPNCRGRYSHYPVVDVEDNQFGHAPHSDHGFLTFLPLSKVPGLEILTQSGKWIPAPYIDGAILVNTGEFLNRWTNGKFIATPHRVLSPKADRYSLTYFYNPSDETVAEPLDTCITTKKPAQYQPITFFDYLAYYSDGNFHHSKYVKSVTG